MSTAPTTTAAKPTKPAAAKRQEAPTIPAKAPAGSGPDLHVVDPTAADARMKLHDIERELGATFAERDREIRGVITALVAGEHVLLLGPAGTGKSALAQVLCAAIDGGNYFEWLLSRFSVPEELFGPVSLDGLKHDAFRRVTRGKLPEAHVGFLDEIFKANSAVLNSLLTILNERRFDNDGARHDVPIEMVIGASNELPEGPELGALFDRFLLRYWTSYTRTPDAFTRLMCGDEPSITTRISLDEITAAQEEAASVAMPQATVDELFKLRAELKGKAIEVSDRRWRKAAKVLRATAWLDGANEVTPDVFPILAHVLWDTPDQANAIGQMVARYASAELADAQEAFDAVMGLVNELPQPDDANFGSKVTGITREMKRAAEKIQKLKEGAKPAIATKIGVIGAELDRKFKVIREQAQKALGL